MNMIVESPIDYTVGLIVIALLLVVLWALVRLERSRAEKEQKKAFDELEKIKL